MLAALKLFRPLNCLMAFVAVFIGGWAFREWEFTLPLFAIALTWAMFTAAANMINDVFDIEIDKFNHPDRPLTKGSLKPSVVMLCAGILILPGFYISVLVSVILLLLVTGCLVLDYAYEKWLKDRGLMGNMAVGLLVGSAFLAGGIALDNIMVGAIIGYLAFLANTGREIVKDMEDIEGDIGRRTAAKAYGMKKANILAGMFFISPVVFGLAIFYPLGYGSFLYPVFMVLSGVCFITATVIAQGNPKLSQNSAKMGMVLALAGFLFG